LRIGDAAPLALTQTEFFDPYLLRLDDGEGRILLITNYGLLEYRYFLQYQHNIMDQAKFRMRRGGSVFSDQLNLENSSFFIQRTFSEIFIKLPCG